MSLGDTIVIFVVALIVFGPKKLPEIARQVGRYLNEFRRASNEFKAQIEQEIAHLEREDARKILPPSEPPVGVASRSVTADTGDPVQGTADAPATLAVSTPESETHSQLSSEESSSAIESAPVDDKAAASQESHA